VNPIQRLDLREQVVVVVGGHGDIGTAVCTQAHELGATVVAASRRLAGAHQPWTSLVVDITSLSSVREFADELDRRWGRIDVLVNTAGITRSVPPAQLDLLTDEVLAEVFESNAIAPIRLVRELLPLLRRGLEPAVVQVSSVAARTGQGSNIAYGAAKAAIDATTVAFAKALGSTARFVNVAPSALANEFVPGRPAAFFERTIAATPLGRLATADEVASSILVAARVLTATTGVTIAVDGGRHL
jgi:3-oxoacyl-[acyl-carrier protein] reductase